MSGVDTTGQYRHGILIGNWNEDKYGIQHAGNLGIQATPDTYQSVQKASFRCNNQEAASAFHESRNNKPPNAGVPAEILFEHKGADEAPERFKTTYDTKWNAAQQQPIGPGAEDPTRRTSLMKKKQAEWAQETKGTRDMAYTTENSGSYHNGNSAIAQPADNKFIRKGVLERTFDSPFRKMRLRNE